MSQHELIARLRLLDRPSYNEAADALEAQAREMEALQSQEAELCTLYGLAKAECEKLRAEIGALRKKAERYDYLTLQHGDYCVTAADTAGAIFKGDAADQLIDAAKGEPHG